MQFPFYPYAPPVLSHSAINNSLNNSLNNSNEQINWDIENQLIFTRKNTQNNIKPQCEIDHNKQKNIALNNSNFNVVVEII